MEELLKYEDLVPESTERPLPIQSLTEELWAKNLCWLQVWKAKRLARARNQGHALHLKDLDWGQEGERNHRGIPGNALLWNAVL